MIRYRVRLEQTNGAYRVINLTANNGDHAQKLALSIAGENWTVYDFFELNTD